MTHSFLSNVFLTSEGCFSASIIIIFYHAIISQLLVAAMRTDAPKITCDDAEAALGDYNVRLRCYVDSRPSPASLFWLTEPNVTLSAATSTSSDPPSVVVPVVARPEQYSTLVRVVCHFYFTLCLIKPSTTLKCIRLTLNK